MTRNVLLAAVAAGMAVTWAALPAAQAPAPAKANWLTDGGDAQRTSWQRNETLISPASVKGMKLIWKLQLDNKSRQLHNLFPPLIVSDVQTSQGPKQIGIVAGVSDNVYGIDLDTGKQIWKRQFDSTFEEPKTGRGAYTLCPGGLTATPIVVPDRHAWQVQRLCDLVGRPAPPARCRDRRGPRAAGAVSAGERQAVRAEHLQQRPLHDDRAGLWRQSEPVLQLRPGDEEGRQLQPRQRRAVAAPRSVDRQGRQRLRRERRRRLFPRAAGLRPGHHRREAEPGDESARDDRLVRAVERGLAAQARSRHERHRSGLRVQGQGVHGPLEQGVPDLAPRHQCAGRRGSPHARLPHAARLQRGSAVRGGRAVGRAGDMGGHRRHALGAHAVLGARSTRSSRPRRNTAKS